MRVINRFFILTLITLGLLYFGYSTILGKSKSTELSQEHMSTDASSVKSLKILSWNIYMLPPLILITGKQKRAKHIGDILATSDYDVIVFQEAFHPTVRKILEEKLSKRFPYSIGPINPSRGIKTNSGVWFFSRYPLKLIGTVEYKKKAGIDNKMARKGAGLVEVEVGDEKIQIIGTHLNAGGDFSVRYSQAMQIRKELIDVYSKPEIPLIVCGDMNTECDHPEYYEKLVSILGAKDCIPGGYPRCITSNHSDNDFSSKRYKPEVIDYFFYRLPENYFTLCDVPVIQAKWSDTQKSLSDHEPVSLQLRWE